MLLGQYDTETTRIRLRGHHPLRPGIQSCSPHTSFYHSARPRRRPDTQARNTPRATPDGYHTRKVWPGPLSLATTHGISFPAGTEMFHFPAYPPHQGAVTAHDGCRVSPFRNPRIKARSAAPRGISLPATSFIGPVCQGIHHTPLQATPHTGETRKTNEHRTTDHQHSAITKRSNKQPDPQNGDPVEIHQYKQTTTVQQRHGPLASTIQFSNHHATPQPTNPTRGQPATAGTCTPTPLRGPWRPGNPTACPYPPPKGRNDRSTPARPAPAGTTPATPCQAPK